MTKYYIMIGNKKVDITDSVIIESNEEQLKKDLNELLHSRCMHGEAYFELKRLLKDHDLLEG